MLEPIANSITNRPKPILSDKLHTLQEIMNYIDDLACWKADKAEAYLSGVFED